MEEKVLDIKVLIDHIAERCDLSKEEISLVLDLEDEYLTEKNIISNEEPNSTDEVIEIDYEDMVKFIVNKSNSSLYNVEEILMIETLYMVDNGFCFMGEE